MPQWVDSDAVKAARLADLYGFLLHRHYNDVKKEGNSLRLRDNPSISIKIGYSGYTDFSTKETGNSVDFLTAYLGYDFQDAVLALCDYMGFHATGQAEQRDAPEKATRTPKAAPKAPEPVNRTFALPEPLQGQYKQLYAYLTQQRGIPPTLIQQLINDGILYQEAGHANMVFIDPAQTFAELRGSNSYKPFHQVMFDPATPAAFWWYKPRGLDTDPATAYVCEGAIDAMSLYLLLSLDPSLHAEQGLYCSIGGVANQQRIDAIKAGMSAAGCSTIIAVDNDKAGADCRQRNPDCKTLIPAGKDWNEDLTAWEGSTPGAVDRLEQIIKANRKGG